MGLVIYTREEVGIQSKDKKKKLSHTIPTLMKDSHQLKIFIINEDGLIMIATLLAHIVK